MIESWRSPIGGADIVGAGRNIVVVARGRELMGLDAARGTRRWRRQLPWLFVAGELDSRGGGVILLGESRDGGAYAGRALGKLAAEDGTLEIVEVPQLGAIAYDCAPFLGVRGESVFCAVDESIVVADESGAVFAHLPQPPIEVFYRPEGRLLAIFESARTAVFDPQQRAFVEGTHCMPGTAFVFPDGRWGVVGDSRVVLHGPGEERVLYRSGRALEYLAAGDHTVLFSEAIDGVREELVLLSAAGDVRFRTRGISRPIRGAYVGADVVTWDDELLTVHHGETGACIGELPHFARLPGHLVVHEHTVIATESELVGIPTASLSREAGPTVRAVLEYVDMRPEVVAIFGALVARKIVAETVDGTVRRLAEALIDARIHSVQQACEPSLVARAAEALAAALASYPPEVEELAEEVVFLTSIEDGDDLEHTLVHVDSRVEQEARLWHEAFTLADHAPPAELRSLMGSEPG